MESIDKNTTSIPQNDDAEPKYIPRLHTEQIVKISKSMSFMLRHKPEKYGLVLDSEGYVSTDELLIVLQKQFPNITPPINCGDIIQIINDNDKKRFGWDDDSKRQRIRARQGHSIDVSITMPTVSLAQCPVLYHGTSKLSLQSINKQGLLPMTRQHVHLTHDIDIAYTVGKRHTKGDVSNVVVFQLDVKSIISDNIPIYISENGVYLMANVPPKYLSIVEQQTTSTKKQSKKYSCIEPSIDDSNIDNTIE